MEGRVLIGALVAAGALYYARDAGVFGSAVAAGPAASATPSAAPLESAAAPAAMTTPPDVPVLDVSSPVVLSIEYCLS